MRIEFDSRRKPERRKMSCFIDKDRRKPGERRGSAARELETKRRKEFERHLNAQTQ